MRPNPQARTVQLITSRIGNLTRFIDDALLLLMTIYCIPLTQKPLRTPRAIYRRGMSFSTYCHYFLHVCIVITARVRINRVRLPILLVVSWTRKNNISLSPFAPKNLVRRVRQSRPSSVCSSPYSGRIWCLLTGFLPISEAASTFTYLNRHTPPGQSRVYRVTQLRADGVHCRESGGTEPVNLKVVPVTGTAFASPWTN